MARSSAFKNYPLLTGEEFAEVCHQLERSWCQATLGPKRSQWQLRVCAALNTAFSLGPEYSTFLQIIRPILVDPQDEVLSSFMENLSLDEVGVREDAVGLQDGALEAEMVDEAAVVRQAQPSFAFVRYEIHLHPTYQAPCLWFSLHGLPPDEDGFDIDTIFRHLVPELYQDGLRGAGPMSGISMEHHPVTGLPSYFVHPCLLGEAMSGFECGREDYLMVWIGLVGACVGLWVPKEMAGEMNG